jgi:hypothetical protein
LKNIIYIENAIGLMSVVQRVDGFCELARWL